MKKEVLKKELKEYFAEQGSKGGKISAQRLTAQERIERARKAGRAHGRKKKTA